MRLGFGLNFAELRGRRQTMSEVIVIGGGIAGICAALELLDAGRRVVMLERDNPDNFGGLAKESFGGIFLVGTPEQRRAGIRDTPELALADWRAFGELDADDRWPQAWAEAYVHRCRDDVGGWLRQRGIGFLPAPHWVERGLYTPGNSVPRFHIVWGTGRELALRLIDQLEHHPQRAKLELRFGHRVESLLTSSAAVTGCQGVSEEHGQPFELHAGSVIVAAGGFNGNIERVRQHWHRDWGTPPPVILNGSHRFADGRLHDAVGAIGGQLTHLDAMWNYAAGVHHPRPRKPGHGLSLVPPRSALWLNWRGQRIGPMPLVTGFDTRDLVAQVCAQERQYSWQLMNRRIALKELAVSGAEFNPSIRDKKKLAFLRDLIFGNQWLYDQMISDCEDFVTGRDLPELVAKMNALQGDDAVDLEAMRTATERYDAQIDRGQSFHNDEQLRRIAYVRHWKGDRIRTCKFQKILDPDAGPLIAVREFIISRKSLGGIQTDLQSRVLDHAGRPMAGLYAAGEAAGFGGGGMHGLRALEGSFLGGCVLSGRIAGQAAAAAT
ncbi:MAG: fumarate reductase [Rhodocyclales bacterium GWA2_65_19]|nr:MAG: fumarate reductase [Rhodocyclales bacterium GWA2_65_19]